MLTDDEQAIETRHLGFTISPHEECGVEEAVRLVEAHGGDVDRAHARARRRPRSSCATAWRSASTAAIHLVTDGSEWDAQATAAAIVEAIAAERAPSRST